MCKALGVISTGPESITEHKPEVLVLWEWGQDHHKFKVSHQLLIRFEQ